MREVHYMRRAAGGGTIAALKIKIPTREDLVAKISNYIVGHEDVVREVIPSIVLYNAGLAPDGTPIGAFLLSGTTGTGKTYLVEQLALCLHGNEKSLLKINCGEFQLDHEIAKLIGAPPGYLGHRETVPMISRAKLDNIRSENSSIALLLFDEFDKAAPSMHRILLGVLDKGTLSLGDNTVVDMTRTLIFFTTNLGQDGVRRYMRDFGFATRPTAAQQLSTIPREVIANNIERDIANKFPLEFRNRLTASLILYPLAPEELRQITEKEINKGLNTAQDNGIVNTQYEPGIVDFILERGIHPIFGARELKRTIRKYITIPLAEFITENDFDKLRQTVCISVAEDKSKLELFVV